MEKLSGRHESYMLEDWKEKIKNYVIACPCCGTILHFNREDVYKAEDNCCVHHEYVDCPECNEEIQLSDDFYYGY